MKLGHWFWRRIFFIFLQRFFCYVLCQVWLKLPHIFLRRRFSNFVNVLSLFLYYLPIGRGRCTSFEQTRIFFTQGCSLVSLVEIGRVVQKKIFIFRQCIFNCSILSPIGKWHGLLFEQTWISFTRGFFVPNLVEICPVVLEKKMKMWRFIDTWIYGLTDDGQ